MTSKLEPMAYARICVEMDIKSSFPSSLKVAVLNEDLHEESYADVIVEYQSKPHKCTSCMSFGHSTLKCPFSSSTWVPKPPPPSKQPPLLPTPTINSNSDTHTSSTFPITNSPFIAKTIDLPNLSPAATLNPSPPPTVYPKPHPSTSNAQQPKTRNPPTFPSAISTNSFNILNSLEALDSVDNTSQDDGAAPELSLAHHAIHIDLTDANISPPIANNFGKLKKVDEKDSRDRKNKGKKGGLSGRKQLKGVQAPT